MERCVTVSFLLRTSDAHSCVLLYIYAPPGEKKLQIFYEKMSLGQEGFFFLEQLAFPISDLCVRVIFLIFLFFLGKRLDLRDDLFLMPPYDFFFFSF